MKNIVVILNKKNTSDIHNGKYVKFEEKNHIKPDFINCKNIISVIKYYIHIYMNIVPWNICFNKTFYADLKNCTDSEVQLVKA